jgi:hypothetical protein
MKANEALLKKAQDFADKMDELANAGLEYFERLEAETPYRWGATDGKIFIHCERYFKGLKAHYRTNTYLAKPDGTRGRKIKA